VHQLQKGYGWAGVFLDNVDASFDKHSRMLNYPDVPSYQTAVLGFLEYISTNYFRPENRPLYANIVGLPDDDQTVWFDYLRFLDGVLIEDFGVDWAGGYYGWAMWEEQLNRVERTAALGEGLILLGQGEQDDAQRQTFAFASYLLVSNGQMFFRYTMSKHYNELWWYDNYSVALGDPLGPRYKVGETWYRDFAGGQVMVNPVQLTASITTR
jgi:hypothetical protein